MTREEIQAYTMRITRASRSDLVVILYDMAIQYIKEGVTALQAGKAEAGRESLNKARRVVNRLSGDLDMQYPVSAQLFSLYSYMNRALIHAGVSLKVTDAEALVGMLLKLRDAFLQVAGEDTTGPMMRNTQQVYAGMTYSRNSLNENYGSIQDLNRGIKA